MDDSIDGCALQRPFNSLHADYPVPIPCGERFHGLGRCFGYSMTYIKSETAQHMVFFPSMARCQPTLRSVFRLFFAVFAAFLFIYAQTTEYRFENAAEDMFLYPTGISRVWDDISEKIREGFCASCSKD